MAQNYRIIEKDHMTASLTTDGLMKLHTSRYRGYVSRKNPDGVLMPYKGRFGKGVAHLTPAWDSSQYCYITYYVEDCGE